MWCRQYTPISDYDQRRWWEKINTDPTIKMYSLRDSEDRQVGVCGFTSIDRHNRSAEFSLYINPEHQKRGFGQEGLTLLLNHGFFDWGFHRIWGEVFEGNHALKIFERLGFHRCGILRDSYWSDGSWIDSTIIDILSDDWDDDWDTA
jgi:ribosomal-protein-alanine N-acetyltransferase